MLSTLAVAAPAVVAGAIPAVAGIGFAVGRESAVRASEEDPIFAAINCHRKAVDIFEAACVAQSRLETKLPSDRAKSSYCQGEASMVESDDPRWLAAVRATYAASEVMDGAALDILDIRPTTLAGAAAVVAYAADHVRRGNTWPDGLVDDGDGASKYGRDWSVYFHEAMTEALMEIDHLQMAC